jgi:signal peptidase I
MEEKIKKINLKTLSIIGIILPIITLILSIMFPTSGNEEMNLFDSYAVITVFLAVLYLLIFSILNLFRPRKVLSILGMILAFLAIILGSIVAFKPSQSQLISPTLLGLITDFLFLFSVFFLGIISIVSFFKSIYEPAETQKPKSKIETIIEKTLWTFGALFLGLLLNLIIQASLDLYVHLAIPDYLSFYKNPPQWYFQWQTILSWMGFIFGWSVIIFIIYKKVGVKIAKIFLLLPFFLLFLRAFVIDYSIMTNEGLKPYLNKGDYFVAQKLNKNPQKGDIVIIKTPRGNIVSLVIGLEGDKIELKNGTFFVNGKALENVVYDFDQVSGINSFSQQYFIVVPKGYFYGIPTSLIFEEKEYEKKVKETKTVELLIYLYEKQDIIGKLIFPKRKIVSEKYTGSDSCNGYPPISCPEGSKYYCPTQGKPFCCKEEPIEGFCIECLPGERIALGVDQKKMCCKEELICNNICYSECPEGEIFKCDPLKGGYCEITKCPPNEILALASDGKTKICCKRGYVCKGICYSECPSGQSFKCDPIEGGYCEITQCPSGEVIALGADKKTKTCCEKEYVCEGICYAKCPKGQIFRCDPERGAYCEITECPEGEVLGLTSDKKTKICCKKEYFCQGICWAPCPSGQVFKCDPERGAYCEVR